MGSTADRVGLRAFRIEVVAESLVPNTRLPDDADVLEFSELPDDLSLAKSANYRDEEVPGRTEPLKSYASSAPTRINFTAKLMAQGKMKDNSLPLSLAGKGLELTGRFVPRTQQFLGVAGNLASLPFKAQTSTDDLVSVIFEEVHRKAAWLEALTYAQYDDQGRAYPPPMVRLIFGGNLLRTGVVRDLVLTFKGPWEVNTLLSYLVECNITFEEVNRTPKSYLDVLTREQPELGTAGNALNPKKITVASIDNARSIFGI